MKRIVLMLLLSCSIQFSLNASFLFNGIYYDRSGTNAYVTYASSAFNSYSGNIIIPERAIYSYVDGIYTINSPCTVNAVGASAFRDCVNLSAVTIPNTVTSIGAYAFYNCKSITSIYLPSVVSSIGNSAFSGCETLTSITIPTSTTTIGTTVFLGCNKLNSIDVSLGNSNFTSKEGVLFNKALTTLLCFPCGKIGQYIIPETVTTISNSAFQACLDLSKISIPTSVTNIGNSAFADCINLTSIYVFNNTPLDLSNVNNVFSNVDKTKCSLFVPPGTKNLYQNSNQWKEFVNIQEVDTTINLNCNEGQLSSILNNLELKHVKHLTISGKMDARDFRVIRDSMPALLTLNIEDVSISTYSGTLGTILNTLNTYPNNTIPKRSFYNKTAITSIKLPKLLTQIDDYSFTNCAGLIGEISFPEHLTVIGSEAFSGCIGYTGSLKFPESVKKIGNSAFKNCNNLSGDVIIPIDIDSINESVFYYCSKLTSILLPEKLRVIKNSAFEGCSSLKGKFIIPNSVNFIGSYAFRRCVELDSIILPDKLDIIWGSTFEGCSKLKNIIIPSTVTDIGGSAFSGCTSLSGTIIIPENIKYIGTYVFENCTNINKVIFNATNCTTVRYGAFSSCNALTEIAFGDNVTNIPDNAFYDCKSLKNTLNLPNSLTNIGINAFKNCSGYTGSLVFPTKLKKVGATAFNGCTGFTNLVISEDIDSIGDNAFIGCTGLNTVSFNANNCKFMGSTKTLFAFSGCTSLKTINFGSNVTNIPNNAFNGLSSLSGSLKLPISLKYIGDNAFIGCTGLNSELSFPASLKNIGQYAFYGCIGLNGNLFLPDSLENIGKYAFTNCKISSLRLGNNVKTIGNNAFSGCQLIEGNITFPNTLVNISDDLFYNCSNLKSIKLGANLTSIGFNAFYGCTSMECELIIPDSVTVIKSNAFYNCSKINSLILGKKISTIGEKAFYNCYGIADHLTIPNNITTIGNYAFWGCKGIKKLSFVDGISTLSFGSSILSSEAFTDSPIDSLYLGRNITFYSNYSPFKAKTSLKSVIIGKDVSSLMNSSFASCIKLSKVIINDGLTTLSFGSDTTSSSVFRDCPIDTLYVGKNIMFYSNYSPFKGKTLLKKITIGDKVTSLPSNSFSDCINITEITTPFIGTSNLATGENALLGALFGTTNNSVMSAVQQYYDASNSKIYYVPSNLKKLTLTRPASQIGYGALYGCNMLEELTISSSVQGLGEKALYGCNKLKKITSRWAYPPTAYNSSTFEGVNKFACTLYVPLGSKQFYSVASGWKEFYSPIDKIQEEAPFAITSLSIPQYGGEVTGNGLFNPDSNVTLNAIANLGYTFKYWKDSVGIISYNRELSFNATKSTTFYAVFAPEENKDANIVIETYSDKAKFTWNSIQGSTKYTLSVFTDSERKNKLTELQINAGSNINGTLTQIVTNLSIGNLYYYSLESYDKNNILLSLSNGNFVTRDNTGILDNREVDFVKLFPNPSNDFFCVNGIDNSTFLTLIDLSSRIVLQKHIQPNERISIKNLKSGIYFVSLNNRLIKSVKLIII